MESFNHNLTDYPLIGKHEDVDCKKCHLSRYTDLIEFEACKNCHEDYHRGEFINKGEIQDCDICHSIYEGFEVSLFTIDDHENAKFPLTGSHIATPCYACHISEDRWTFRNIGNACVDCHANIHGDRFEVNGVTDCERCHETNSWFPSKFDHNKTKFPLDGKHAEVDCLACHKIIVDEKGKEIVNYKIERFECIDCHQ
jgi:hypothetical protein